jgi:hypothetical protein
MKVIDSTLIGFGKALMVPGAFFLKVGLEFWQRAALVTERFLSFRPQGSLAGGEWKLRPPFPQSADL